MTATYVDSVEPAEATNLAAEIDEQRQFDENEAFNAWREFTLSQNPDYDFYA
jgi:hypothetical protein